MARNKTSLFSLSLLLIAATACSTAYADRAAPAAPAGRVLAPAPAESPYSFDIIDESGFPLTAYQHRGRIYVLGTAGQRYTLRVTNPTPRRIEAVVSVDGLDVIDGEPADMRKRGYVVPPHGELRVDGFRVSTAHVAAFRFSSVQSSYAGRKGKARNVGVIGVAIFEEQEASALAFEAPRPPPPRPYHRYEGAPARDQAAPGANSRTAPEAKKAPARSGRAGGPARGSARRSAPPSSAQGMGHSGGAPAEALADYGSGAEAEDSACCSVTPRPRSRPGLGTEFGEQRHSAVSWTRFVRAHARRPSTVLELRYNDAPGLQALGIALVDHDDTVTRETANPFPGDFARPPY